MLPILSGSLYSLFQDLCKKYDNRIIKEICAVHYANDKLNNCFGNSDISYVMQSFLDSHITDEVRMITLRAGELDVSFLPKDKTPEYTDNGNWARTNRQTGKPAKIFKKLLTTEFKPVEWEEFSNIFKSEICDCTNFKIVRGEDIRTWYCEDNYYKVAGTLGNSCMRYASAQDYFDIYVDNAEMLITTKDGLLTGRALVWHIGDITLMDRVYTCFDYLYNCFIDYAKEHGWWIRDNNGLLSTGDDQYWLIPDDNYTNCTCKPFTLTLSKQYALWPYMDSFRYYDGDKTLSTNDDFEFALDSTDGEMNEGSVWVCERCGERFHSRYDEQPDEIHWSEYDECYYCDDCCWYSSGLETYVNVNYDSIDVYYNSRQSDNYPDEYVNERLIENPDGSETSSDIVCIDERYYFVTDYLKFNKETAKYEIRSNSD